MSQGRDAGMDYPEERDRQSWGWTEGPGEVEGPLSLCLVGEALSCSISSQCRQ